MQEVELRFQSLKEMMLFKQQAQVTELRIDTVEKSLTGRFSETEIANAVSLFKANIFRKEGAGVLKSIL